MLDTILIMMVNPGFGGQSLLQSQVAKIKQARKLYPSLSIQVDGGVTKDNIKILAKAGANNFVAGSAIFKQKDRKQAITQLKNQIINK